MGEVPKTELNTQLYKLAGTGAGVIVCQKKSRNGFRSLLSMRTSLVGIGLGITGGGFVENGAIFLYEKPGYIIETAAEAWRETREENPGFEEIVPLNEFVDRAQSISTLHVRVDDENGVHSANFYALTVTDDEWNAIALLKGNDERDGMLIEVWCEFYGRTLYRQNAGASVRLATADGLTLKSDFYHKHELLALGQIAWHVQQGFLWDPPM
jgi:hypothetical protein